MNNNGKTVAKRSIDTDTCNLYTIEQVNAAVWQALQMLCPAQVQPMNIDNPIGVADMSEGDTDMAKQKKIRRPIMINGEKHWISAESEQEYAEKCAQAMQLPAAQTPQTQCGEKHNFKDYANRWFEVFSKPSVEEVTAITYERQLKAHIFPVLGSMNVEDITPSDVQTVFNSMGDVAKETKNKTKMVLNMVFVQALEDDLIKKNPLQSKSVRVTGRMSKPTRPYSVEQMQYLVQNIGKVKKPMDKAYLALTALHPLSPEEALGLMGDDVDSEHIYIRRAVTHPDRNRPVIKDTKKEVRMRRIDLVQQIAQYLPETAPDEFIIGGQKPLTCTQVRRMCERIQRDTGFDEKITPQRFRTTVLTDLYDATKDIKQVQAAAGHTTAAMTLKHYVKGRHEQRNTAIPVASVYGLA